MSPDNDHDSASRMVRDYSEHGTIFSDSLSGAVTSMAHIYPGLGHFFQPILDGLHVGPHIHHDTNLGYDTRQAVGITLGMALNGEWEDGKRLSPSNLGERLSEGFSPLSETNPDLYQKITTFYNDLLKPVCFKRLYHSSPNLFECPDPARIIDKWDGARTEYGWGFYTATDFGTAAELTASLKDAVIYSIDIPKKDFDTRWMKASEPVGMDLYQKLEEKSQSVPELARFLTDYEIKPDSARRDLSNIARGFAHLKPKAGAELMTSLGIDGYVDGCYALSYKPETHVLKPEGGKGKYAPTPEERENISLYQKRMAGMLSAQRALENHADVTGNEQRSESKLQFEVPHPGS